MNEKELGCLVALSRQEILSPAQLAALMKLMGGPVQLFEATTARLISLGVSENKAAAFTAACRKAKPQGELDLCYSNGVEVVPDGHPKYPPSLAPLPDRPLVLFVRGSTEALLWPMSLAMVGTRAMTNYGRAVVGLLAGPLAKAGFCLVSGLALGVDAAVHATALDADGLTVAVLGSGVDRASVGPKTNSGLAERIIANDGALVSEYPPGIEGRKDRFPMRNRIIAGLSSGVLVVEAAEKSGALITVRAALEYGRDVFAVPGPITQAASAGVNGLLKQGAVPVSSADDILLHYGLNRGNRRTARAPAPDDPDQRAVLAVVDAEPAPPDVISLKSGLIMARTMAALSALELDGLIRQSDGLFLPQG